jgi:hypothetical protein
MAIDIEKGMNRIFLQKGQIFFYRIEPDVLKVLGKLQLLFKFKCENIQ